MRILLAFVVIVVLSVSTGVFVYLFRDKLKLWFGLVPAGEQKSSAKARDAELGHVGYYDDELNKAAAHPGGSAIGGTYIGAQSLSALDSGGAAVAPTDSRNSSESSRRGGGGSLSLGNSANPHQPMIVISSATASQEKNRGTSLWYDDLKKACDSWNDALQLGHGGAAIVYRGNLPSYGQVAVKRFHSGRETGAREWTRELEALCEFRHPNILEIIGHADDGPENLIVMPLMVGGTFSANIPSLHWSARAVLCGQIMHAIAFLHGKGTLHRDIKSSNILLDTALRHARLADFGLAKEKDPTKSHGTTAIVMGSPGYMAPELMMRAATEKTDAFAFGTVMLEILAGLPAWDPTIDGGSSLVDRAIGDGVFNTKLVDFRADWPAIELSAVSKMAIDLTAFNPAERKTVIAIERESSLREHLERAERHLLECPPTVGSRSLG